MTTGKRIGIVIPSSNVVIEPLVVQRFQGSPDTVHFSRLSVLDVKLDAQSLAQFEMEEHLRAARQLCDARVDVIVWGGAPLPVGWASSMTRNIANASPKKQVSLQRPVYLK
ncbi:hypothetical protein N9W76_05175 [Planktomarina temperata]|nr:hypothetical protein [Planktomarina temperata]